MNESSKNVYSRRDCSTALKQWLEGHMLCCGAEFVVLLFEVDDGGGENSHLFPCKWESLPAWVQMGPGCFESRKKAKCIELGSLAAFWHLLWAWAFLHKNLFTRTLLMLFCDCLLRITPFTFNLLEMDWIFSLLLEGAHFSDGIYEEVLNQAGSPTKNWFKIRIGACGQSLATVACSSVVFVLCLRWEHGRRDALRIQMLQACLQLCLSRQVSYITHLLHLMLWGLSCLFSSAADCWIANPPSQFHTMGPLWQIHEEKPQSSINSCEMEAWC